MNVAEFAPLSHPSLDEVPSEADWLVERLRQADPAAVGEVYDEHHRAVRAFAKRLVGESSEAEDLVHEVFVSLPKVMKNYRGESPLRTFLIAIALTTARHHVRAAARRRRAMSNFAEQPELGVSADPEQDARRRQLAKLLARALDALTLEHRVAVVLCDVEERSSREAADIIGVPEATVRTRLFYARKKLRAALEKEDVR